MKKQKLNGNSMAYLFCLWDVFLQRYNTSKFEKNTFFSTLAAEHIFYIAFSA